MIDFLMSSLLGVIIGMTIGYVLGVLSGRKQERDRRSQDPMVVTSYRDVMKSK